MKLFWMMQKVLLRVKQKMMKKALGMLLPPVPQVTGGPGKIRELPGILKKEGVDNVLVVTDKILMDLGIPKGLLAALEESGIRYTVFDDVQPNPVIRNIEDGLDVYRANHCRGIIAFGGGSPMDCAKFIGTRAVHPNRSIPQLRGLFKIKKDLPPLYAVPTTAGTGSEATIAAVVLDPETHEKYGIGDRRLVPDWAVLDPELTVSLPPHITAATGMDALTHAVEAYISGFATPVTDRYAEKAARLVFGNLERAYRNGSDLDARDSLLRASYYAGLAFTRAMVGYVHAIAHNMGGLYGIPHGLANAVVLPHVLDYSRKDAEKKLARLAVAARIGGNGDTDAALSRRLLDRIREMNRSMAIPTGFKEIRPADISLIVRRTLNEANSFYAPPTLMNAESCEAFVRSLMR